MTNKLAGIFSALNAPVKGKAISYLTNALGGEKTLNFLRDEALEGIMAKTYSKALRSRLANIHTSKIPFSRELAYRKGMNAYKSTHGRLPGSFWGRKVKKFVDDVAHPIRNSKSQLMSMLYTADNKGRMVPRSALGVAGNVALGVGFPAWMISDVAKDKSLSTPKKIGKSVAYTALPLTSRRLLPSLVGYDLVDRAFKSTPPKAVS